MNRQGAVEERTIRKDEGPVGASLAGRVCRVLMRYGPAALLAGYLLFAHGCHGDEDNELFSACTHGPVVGGRQ